MFICERFSVTFNSMEIQSSSSECKWEITGKSNWIDTLNSRSLVAWRARWLARTTCRAGSTGWCRARPSTTSTSSSSPWSGSLRGRTGILLQRVIFWQLLWVMTYDSVAIICPGSEFWCSHNIKCLLQYHQSINLCSFDSGMGSRAASSSPSTTRCATSCDTPTATAPPSHSTSPTS